MTTNILVLGATGKVGAEVVRILAEANAADKSPTQPQHLTILKQLQAENQPPGESLLPNTVMNYLVNDGSETVNKQTNNLVLCLKFP